MKTESLLIDEMIESDQDATIKDYIEMVELVKEFETICRGQINTQE